MMKDNLLLLKDLEVWRMKFINTWLCLLIRHVVNKNNNRYYTTTKMKPTDVKSGIYGGYDAEHSEIDSKFKIGHHSRSSKNKNILLKVTL